MSEKIDMTATSGFYRLLIPGLILSLGIIGSVAAVVQSQHQLPKPLVLSSVPPENPEQRCSECHSDITDGYHQAPHSRTLTRASDPQNVKSFAGRSFQRSNDGPDFHYDMADGRLRISTPNYAQDIFAEWIFGSGTHARTPLITWNEADGRTMAIEHAVSWYPDGQLGVTLGMQDRNETSGVNCVGILRPTAEAVNCFGCHATHVPVHQGHIQMDQIVPGIGCSRCHWEVAAHVHEMDHHLPSTIERFSQLTPLEAIDRCGECHRRAAEMGGEVTPEDTTIVRFASVGLVQSPCFQKQDQVTLASGKTARLDCASCHNPHRPTSRRWQDHAAVCLTCHDAAHDRSVDCPVAARTSNCLECHMPQLPENPHLSFTDHWIRVRDDQPVAEESGRAQAVD